MDYMQDSLKKQLLTVQDFIAAHPGEAFHLMTPGGYVDLTAAQAAELLINIWLLITVAFVPALLPILYSYIYYKKKQ